MLFEQGNIFIEFDVLTYLITISSRFYPLNNIYKEVSTSMVIIVRVPSIKIQVFFAQYRPERYRHRIYINHPFILDLPWLTISPHSSSFLC